MLPKNKQALLLQARYVKATKHVNVRNLMFPVAASVTRCESAKNRIDIDNEIQIYSMSIYLMLTYSLHSSNYNNNNL